MPKARGALPHFLVFSVVFFGKFLLDRRKRSIADHVLDAASIFGGNLGIHTKCHQHIRKRRMTVIHLFRKPLAQFPERDIAFGIDRDKSVLFQNADRAADRGL